MQRSPFALLCVLSLVLSACTTTAGIPPRSVAVVGPARSAEGSRPEPSPITVESSGEAKSDSVVHDGAKEPTWWKGSGRFGDALARLEQKDSLEAADRLAALDSALWTDVGVAPDSLFSGLSYPSLRSSVRPGERLSVRKGVWPYGAKVEGQSEEEVRVYSDWIRMSMLRSGEFRCAVIPVDTKVRMVGSIRPYYTQAVVRTHYEIHGAEECRMGPVARDRLVAFNTDLGLWMYRALLSGATRSLK